MIYTVEHGEYSLYIVFNNPAYFVEYSHIAFSEFAICLPNLSPYSDPPRYLPRTVKGVIEECLHSTFEGLPIPTEFLTDILQHLCIT